MQTVENLIMKRLLSQLPARFTKNDFPVETPSSVTSSVTSDALEWRGFHVEVQRHRKLYVHSVRLDISPRTFSKTSKSFTGNVGICVCISGEAN